jgi:hypothetical protein
VILDDFLKLSAIATTAETEREEEIAIVTAETKDIQSYDSCTEST